MSAGRPVHAVTVGPRDAVLRTARARVGLILRVLDAAADGAYAVAGAHREPVPGGTVGEPRPGRDERARERDGDGDQAGSPRGIRGRSPHSGPHTQPRPTRIVDVGGLTRQVISWPQQTTSAPDHAEHLVALRRHVLGRDEALEAEAQ